MGDDGNPLLCDFGHSKFLARRGFTTRFSGAYRYMSPELFSNDQAETEDTAENEGTEDIDSYEPITTKPSDIYALSLVCVEVRFFPNFGTTSLNTHKYIFRSFLAFLPFQR